MSFHVGEALCGDGNEVAHIDLLIGDKDGPVGTAFANALATQSHGHSNLLAVLEEGQAEILEIEVPAGYTPTALVDLQAPPDSIVGAILRGDQVIVPHGSDRIQGGDTLLVFTTAASAPHVRDFFLPRSG